MSRNKNNNNNKHKSSYYEQLSSLVHFQKLILLISIIKADSNLHHQIRFCSSLSKHRTTTVDYPTSFSYTL